MRNVAKRMMNGELTGGLLAWRTNMVEAKNQLRGEGIMRRVALRMLNRALSDKMLTWREAQVADKNQARAEAIMQRVAARWRHKDLSLNWSEWYRNYKTGILDMVTDVVLWWLCVCCEREWGMSVRLCVCVTWTRVSVEGMALC